jgi:predicted nucleic acid-binding protein
VGLTENLGRGPVGVDTALFIYFIEEHPRFLRLVEPLFAAANEGKLDLVTSALTLLEVLVVPFKAGNLALAERYESLLTRSAGVRIVDLTREQLRAAAQLRAATAVRTPDALQLAAALTSGCTSFITHDRRLPAVSGTRVLQLADYATA